MDATNPIIMTLLAVNNGLIQPLFQLTVMLVVTSFILSYMIKPLRRAAMRLARNPRVFLPLAAIFGSGISAEALLGYLLG